MLRQPVKRGLCKSGGWAAVTGGVSGDQSWPEKRKRAGRVSQQTGRPNGAASEQQPGASPTRNLSHGSPHWPDIQQESHSCIIWANSSVLQNAMRVRVSSCHGVSSHPLMMPTISSGNKPGRFESPYTAAAALLWSQQFKTLESLKANGSFISLPIPSSSVQSVSAANTSGGTYTFFLSSVQGYFSKLKRK